MAVVMMLTLLWLSVSTPFVYQTQQTLKQSFAQDVDPADEDSNPFSNTTEEKSESGVNSISEYLHEMHQAHHPARLVRIYYKCHPSDLYIDHHPELFSPPPEA